MAHRKWLLHFLVAWAVGGPHSMHTAKEPFTKATRKAYVPSDIDIEAMVAFIEPTVG